MNLFELTGKIVFITGGTRGIGLSIAMAMKEAGAKVWIHGSKEESTAKIAKKYGFSYVYGNLKEVEKIDEMLNPFLQEEEKLDVLVNNAGFETHCEMQEICEEELDAVYNVNTKSPLFIIQKVLPLIRKAGGGSIINVTSIHQKVPVRTNGAYCLSKSALSMYTKVAALELAKENIRVNNLAPGAILTDMNREIVESMDFDQWIPMERVGRSEELAGPAIFLASEASSYITGATLYVDGGYSENLLRY
nr:SDR family oxidoreductase [uncultured Dorea sp.]